ncbi:MAG: hypothetical protein P9M06_04980 [Candidatus Saelkia tenebricola]|nr:hypothetical protein [Candidatus Saelkia tenebricola]
MNNKLFKDSIEEDRLYAVESQGKQYLVVLFVRLSYTFIVNL